MAENDLELEKAFPNLQQSSYKITSPADPKYNCIAFAVGDLTHFWDDVGFRGYSVKGYYWPPEVPSSNILIGWTTMPEPRIKNAIGVSCVFSIVLKWFQIIMV